MPDSYCILLVDDDKDSCEMMSFMLTLSSDNYEVTSANNAREALIRMKNKHFDLYIFDSLLPEIPGIELCAEVRRTDKRTPILFYSGMSDNYYIGRAKAAGANEYLVKPDDLDKLTDTLRKYLI
jgi:two-component system copper resistance phosphate regulon response regulator CusR